MPGEQLVEAVLPNGSCEAAKEAGEGTQICWRASAGMKYVCPHKGLRADGLPCVFVCGMVCTRVFATICLAHVQTRCMYVYACVPVCR